jgi:hypothetical protein
MSAFDPKRTWVTSPQISGAAKHASRLEPRGMDRVFRGSRCCGRDRATRNLGGATMKKLKPSVVAVVVLGAISGAGAQQPSAPQAPQSPDMTFFVTSIGPGKGADLGGIETADRYCQQLASTAGAGNKTWRAPISAPRLPTANQRSMRASASAMVRGKTLRARSWRRISTTYTAITTSSACKPR